jgi:hypothetical protein
MDFFLEKKSWWSYLDPGIRDLLMEAQMLLTSSSSWKDTYSDYSFIVFPAAKAYEGFLKKLFLDLGFINQEEFLGDRYRIGKALNPFLEKEIRETEGVYDKLVEYCGGKGLADQLWYTWKNSRNLLFHWFPNEKNTVDLGEAEERYRLIISSIDAVFKECNIDIGNAQKTNSD